MEVCEDFFCWIGRVLLKVACEMSRCCGFIPISHWEVVALDNIVIVVMCWLTVLALHDKEIRIQLSHGAAFLQKCRNHLIGFRCPNDQLFLIVRVTKHIRCDKCLALVADHIALNVWLFFLKCNHDSHELGDLDSQRMLERV